MKKHHNNIIKVVQMFSICVPMRKKSYGFAAWELVPNDQRAFYSLVLFCLSLLMFFFFCWLQPLKSPQMWMLIKRQDCPRQLLPWSIQQWRKTLMPSSAVRFNTSSLLTWIPHLLSSLWTVSCSYTACTKSLYNIFHMVHFSKFLIWMLLHFLP